MENKSDLRLYVSNIFNSSYFIQSEGKEFKSAYRRLAYLMTNEFQMCDHDVEEVVDGIENLVAEYIMSNREIIQVD